MGKAAAILGDIARRIWPGCPITTEEWDAATDDERLKAETLIELLSETNDMLARMAEDEGSA